MRIVNWAFSRVPALEVIVRIAYWRSQFVHQLLAKVKRKEKPAAPAKTMEPVALASLEEELRRHGVVEGDILIVHSSMQSLSCTGEDPAAIIAMLRRLVGETGTLVMPAIPRYREAVEGVERITTPMDDVIWTYDVQRTPPWTGAIPYKLMKTPGARRGASPLNTVVAIGPHTDEMLAQENTVDWATPCGPTSAWAYCAQKNAKIIALGVDLVHSLTMIHVAEDCHEQHWPIAGWYRNRQFRVKNAGVESLIKVRERHPKWAMHYAERRFSRDLLQHRIAKSSSLGQLHITSVESSALLSFLDARKQSGYPYAYWSRMQ